jgi:SWI/SNF-related matrix-associated actin-dependent regulator 1 of chromatin subfamily A
VAWLVAMLQSQGAALLTDEMGLGKSAQAIAAISTYPEARTVIVCPAIVCEHWRRQILAWGREGDFDWEVMSYEGFRAKPPQAAGFLVLDEIHYLANPKSQRSQAVAGWAATHRPAVIGLSGTPMTSRPTNLWHPLELLWPGRFGRAWNFQERYCDGSFVEVPAREGTKRVWQAMGVSRADELATRLQSVMLRRTKAEVLDQLPALRREMIEIELPLKTRRAIAKAQQAASGLTGASLTAMLSQIEEHKIDAAVEQAKLITESGGRPLILTTRKASAEAIGAVLGCPVATGDDAPEKRRGLLLSGDGPGVATVYSVTTGIDLTEFDCVLFVGLDWTPSTLLQAEARIHRIGQSRAVTIYYMIGLGTLDELVRDRVIGKLEAFGTIVGSGDEAGLAGALAGGDEAALLAQLAAAVAA